MVKILILKDLKTMTTELFNLCTDVVSLLIFNLKFFQFKVKQGQIDFSIIDVTSSMSFIEELRTSVVREL